MFVGARPDGAGSLLGDLLTYLRSSIYSSRSLANIYQVADISLDEHPVLSRSQWCVLALCGGLGGG